MRAGLENAECRVQSAERRAREVSANNYSAICNLPSAIAAVCLILAGAITGAVAQPQALPDTNSIPPLRPPKPELLPGFWEEHGLTVGMFVVASLIATALLLNLRRRPQTPPPPRPDAVAKAALTPLLDQPETPQLLAAVGAVLRRYFMDACPLPAGQPTSSELCAGLREQPTFPAAFVERVTSLFLGMEQRRFGADETGRGNDLVRVALELIEEAEQHLNPPTTEPIPWEATER